MKSRIIRLRELSIVRQAEIDTLMDQRASLKGQIVEFNERELLLKKAEALAATVINKVYAQSSESLEQVLNFGINATYPREVKAVIEQSVSAGRPQLKIGILDGGEEPIDPTEAHGGGLVSILGCLVRVLLIVASGKRRLLILDESFAAVSEDLLEDLSALIKTVVNELGFQIILVSHQQRLADASDVCYRVTRQGVLERD